MALYLLVLMLFIVLCFCQRVTLAPDNRPHVIYIFADDLGFNDVGYNANLSAVLTPNIDRLAAEGVKLGNYYVQPVCTPTRASLLTGRYTIHTGLQHNQIDPTRPSCLPTDEITLAEKMRETGYATHSIGKWHLGFYSRSCLPTNRGFDTFLGLYLSSGDYVTHERQYNEGRSFAEGYDFHRDTAEGGSTAAWEYAGEYSTFIYTSEVQNIITAHDTSSDKPMFIYLSYQAPHPPLDYVPPQYREPFKDTINPDRRPTSDRNTLAAMIYCMDESIGNITETLKSTGLYDNTVIIFTSDNGADGNRAGSNWPLRGGKLSLWEGGIRSVGFVHSPLLNSDITGTTSNALIHVSDWFPTIVSSLAGGSLSGTKPLDGYDVWKTIAEGAPSPRTEILHNIDPLSTVDVAPDSSSPFDTSIFAALRVGDMKIVTGDPGLKRDWTPPAESRQETIISEEPEGKHIWVFNITADPYEMHDLADSNPSLVDQMLRRLQYYKENMVDPIWDAKDINYNPAEDLDGVWGPWDPNDPTVTYPTDSSVTDSSTSVEPGNPSVAYLANPSMALLLLLSIVVYIVSNCNLFP